MCPHSPELRTEEKLLASLTAGWDRCGAPSAARQPDGQFAASFERPGPEFTTSAESKREAYQAARREWMARLLQRGLTV